MKKEEERKPRTNSKRKKQPKRMGKHRINFRPKMHASKISKTTVQSGDTTTYSPRSPLNSYKDSTGSSWRKIDFEYKRNLTHP